MPQRFFKGIVSNRPADGKGRCASSAERMAQAAAGASPSVIEALEDRTMLSTYYVAKNGSDSNSGISLNAPFLSIQRAANLVKPGDTVLIRGGTYRETVTPARSGTSAAPITFKPYNGENVVVSGADVVSSGWGGYKGSIYHATQGWDLGLGNNQVFVDGKMMIEARWPNTTLDISHPTQAIIDKASAGSSSGTLYDSALTSTNWSGAIIHMIPGQSWFGQTGKVTSSSSGKLTFSYQRMSGSETPTGGDRYYLTGKFQALDSAGEWFRDPGTQQLYLWTPNGDSPSNHTVEAKKREYAFDLRLKTNITIQGVDIFAATITSSRSSGNLHISGIDAKYISHFTVMPGRNVSFDDSLMLNGNNNVLENSRIMGAAGNGVVVLGNNTTLSNNIITDTNYNAGNAAGVLAQGSNHKIANNTIYNTGRDGVKIANSSKLKILNNVIHDVCLQATDGGAIYTWGSNGQGTQIAYNRIYNAHNDGYGASGIMLDDGSSNYVVDHNVVFNVDHAMKLNTVSRNHKIYNNTLISDDTTIVGSKSRDFGGSVLKNNIFSNKPEIGKGATVANNLISANPGFTNPAAGDFTLRAGSSALNKGANVAPFTNGFVGGSPDIGAYEFGRAAFKAGAGTAGTSDSVVTPPTPTPTPTTPTPTPTPKPTPDPTPSPSTKNRKATATIEAEGYDATQGVRKDSYRLTYSDHGDWVKYSNVDFGKGVSEIMLRLAVDNRHVGGRVEIHVGSPYGKLAGTLKVKTTGGWDKFVTQTAKVTGLSGVKDIYLVFKGREGVANTDWIKFA